ncbi:MAG: protein translocase subunit SecD [Sporichthyaceae bacterium]|nr:protein translocase subunit SecD [Sporichthyaceae bacterium]
MFGLIWVAAPDAIGEDRLGVGEKYRPRLGLDLEGGTSVILTPRLAPGEAGSITDDALNQAVSIIRNRVDSFGVAESEVTTAGNNIVISIPGKQDKSILATVQQTAELRFRQVLLSGAGAPTPTQSPSSSPTATPSPSGTGKGKGNGNGKGKGTASSSPSATGSPAASPSESTENRVLPKALRAASSPSPTAAGDSPSDSASPTPAPTPEATGKPGAPVTGIEALTPALQKQFAELDCTEPEQVRQSLRRPGADDPDKPLVTCDEDGIEKFALGPAEVLGTDVDTANAGLDTNAQGVATGGWQVQLDFTGEGKRKFAEITRRLAAETGDLNRFGIVLDGLVVSAPTTNEPITGGQARITGNFTQDEATSLANVLKYGALPLTFDPGEVQEISATLGGEQLRAGVIAGLIGLVLVVVYSLLYYRGLGLVTVASLIVAGLLNYGAVTLLGWQIGLRLSLAGVAGLIVAIGITADSFVVYFERLRDEVRDGKTLRVAVETGWVRARRTILAADFVSLLAAVVLYLLSVGGVANFAFVLGLTTVIDLAVVFLFTKPLVTMLARTKFYGNGHKLSGLDPEHLGAPRRTLTTPAAGRRRPSAANPVTET